MRQAFTKEGFIVGLEGLLGSVIVEGISRVLFADEEEDAAQENLGHGVVAAQTGIDDGFKASEQVREEMVDRLTQIERDLLTSRLCSSRVGAFC
jgi:Na+/alanine symporter